VIRPRPLRTPAAFAAALLFSALPALAQPADAADKPAPAEEEETAPAPAKTETKAAASATVDLEEAPPESAKPAATAHASGDPPESFGVAPGAGRCHEAAIHQGDHPEYKDHSCYRNRLEWSGGYLYGNVEIDVGYASYEYPEKKDTPQEAIHDMRGRFTMGPMFNYSLGGGYFLAATGTVVGWVREQENAYQINVDDVYGQVGHTGDWDFQIGRFMTWRVYHKGLGFDLYTLEDNGPSIDFPISNEQYLLHTYEVDYIYLRNSGYVAEVAGRAAAHYYPTRFLGFEAAAAYGLADARGSNTIGGRFAADFHWKYVRASAGAEYRIQKRTATLNEPAAAGPAGKYVECKDCGQSDNKGGGGSLVFKYMPIEIGGDFAKGWETGHVALGGGDGGSDHDKSRMLTRMSYGGYVELDPGSLVFHRSLILGAGYQKTEYIREDFNQRYLAQTVGYVAFPIGFNDAMIKFVFSKANGDRYDPTDPDGNNYIHYKRNMTSGRFRFSTNF
jgi:hypothetical protein